VRGSNDFRKPRVDENAFIEVLLPKLIIRRLSEAEMEAYCRPFRERGAPADLGLARELPIEGEPADVVAIVEEYGSWLAASKLPKLFISAEPGSLLIGRARAFCRTWPNQETVSIKGYHFLQEEAPDEYGEALARFVAKVRAGALG